jgi:AraC-like DNA-binding protein
MDSLPKNLHDLPMKKRPGSGTQKRHGFAGQRMAIVPRPVIEEFVSHSLLRGLHVTDAGFFPKAFGHFINRPEGTPAVVLIACLEGLGKISLEEEEFAIGPGDLVWLPAKTTHAYASDAVNPWSILWVHFDGEEVEGWRSLIFGNDSAFICHVAQDRIWELGLDRVHSILERGHSLLDLTEATNALRNSLSALSRLRTRPGSTLSARSRVAASVERLRADWNRLHRLEKLAAQSGVSISHYSTLFKEETGFAPIDFLIRLRIQNSARRLATSEDSVTEIATASGFEDAYYFSRTFRKVMGCSPRSYRSEFKLSVGSFPRSDRHQL